MAQIVGETPASRASAERADDFREQAGPLGGDATRHLRAAAYLDPRFRAAVIRELVENRYRIPAPSPGVDGALVLEDCLIARRWAVIAAGFDLAIGVVALLISPWTVLVACIAPLMLGAIAVGISQIAGSFRVEADTTGASLERGIGSLAIGLVMLGFGIVTWIGDAGTMTPRCVGALLILVLWTAVGAAHGDQRSSKLASLVHTPPPEYVAGAAFPQLKDLFERLRSKASEAETVYGGFNAFVGSGIEKRDEKWSFTVELSPSAQRRHEEREPDPLETPELHRLIHEGLAELADGSLYPGDLLHRISVRGRLFRSGFHDRAPAYWHGVYSAPDRNGRQALTRRSEDLLDLGSHERLRHYLEARVEIWERQVVASVFLRIHVQGRLLQMEGLPFLLPPVKPEYRKVDQMAPYASGPDTIGSVLSAVAEMPRALAAALAAPAGAVVSGYRSWSRGQWYERMIAAGFPVDHGPSASVRELGTSVRYQQRFQEVDVYRFFASVRKRVATVVLEALRDRGYDTAEFEQFVQSININRGIQNYNTVVAAPQAAGKSARAGRGKTR